MVSLAYPSTAVHPAALDRLVADLRFMVVRHGDALDRGDEDGATCLAALIRRDLDRLRASDPDLGCELECEWIEGGGMEARHWSSWWDMHTWEAD